MTSNKIVRSKTIQCKVSDEEYNKIDNIADEIGLSVSSYARMVCLKTKIDAIVADPKKFINILKVGGGLNKEIPRDKIIQCRLSDDEYKEIAARSTSIGLDIITYLRIVCLMSEINVSIKITTK